MEIFGGFAIMTGFMLMILMAAFCILPFVVLYVIKSKLDRALESLASIESRLVLMEAQVVRLVDNPCLDRDVPETAAPDVTPDEPYPTY